MRNWRWHGPCAAYIRRAVEFGWACNTEGAAPKIRVTVQRQSSQVPKTTTAHKKLACFAFTYPPRPPLRPRRKIHRQHLTWTEIFSTAFWQLSPALRPCCGGPRCKGGHVCGRCRECKVYVRCPRYSLPAASHRSFAFFRLPCPSPPSAILQVSLAWCSHPFGAWCVAANSARALQVAEPFGTLTVAPLTVSLAVPASDWLQRAHHRHGHGYEHGFSLGRSPPKPSPARTICV